jgi:methyl-accepting chemotaxis protein
MRFTIKMKLAALFTLPVVLMVAAIGLGIRGLQEMNTLRNDLIEQKDHANDLAAAFGGLTIAEGNLLLATGSEQLTKAKALIQQERQAFETALNAGQKDAPEQFAPKWARARGFALDLSQGGPDAADAEFRESA